MYRTSLIFSPLRWVCLLLASVAPLSAVSIQALANDRPLIAQPAQVSSSQDSTQVQVNTLNRQWSIQLQQKSLLGSVSGIQQALYDVPVFFEGFVVAKDNSWVRLMRSAPPTSLTTPTDNVPVLTGHIFVDEVLYELQHHENRGGYVLATLGGVDLAPLPGSLSSRQKSLQGKANSGANVVAPKAIKIGIVIDSQYNEHYNQRGLAHALGVINGVDGLYQSQLGLALVVETFRVYDDPEKDPLINYEGTVEQVLDYYRDIRFNDTELPLDLALVHLFSGHVDPQKVIGLGWIDTVCRDDGYDLSLSTPFSYDILLSAHEIAHNLGAVHDDDANCKTDPSVTGSEIMWSELSGDTQPQFSSCSLDRMRNALNASCVADNIDVGLQLSATPVDAGSKHQIEISVANQDDVRIARQVRTTTLFPAGTQLASASAGCIINATTLSCLHGNLPASSYSKSVVDAVLTNSLSPVITSELLFGEFIDTQHLDNRASVQVSLNQVTSSGVIDPAVWHAEADAPALIEQPANDEEASGGSAGAGNTRLIDLLILAFFGWMIREYRIRIQSVSDNG